MDLADKNSLLQISNNESGITMTLGPESCRLFVISQITERVRHWCSLSDLYSYCRIPSNYKSEDQQLVIQLPALPKEWVPLSELSLELLGDREKSLLFASLCNALDKLHQQHFVYGFFVPSLIHVHWESMQVCLDIQPFDTAYPFVNHHLEDYPFEWLPWHSRFAIMPRLADIEVAAIALDYLFGDLLPAELNSIHRRLHKHPESVLFLNRIAKDIYRLWGEVPPPALDMEPTSSSFWLHPAGAPITPGSMRSLQSFLKDGDQFVIAVIERDPQLRTRLLRQQTYAVLSCHVFVTIPSSPIPLSTWRQGIQRIMDGFHHIYPNARGRFRSLYNRLQYLLNHYFTGEDIVQDLADWLFDLCRTIFEQLSEEHVYFILEDCHLLDAGTLEVFDHFTEKYGSRMPKLHFILSGEELPKALNTERFLQVKQMPAENRYYQRTLLSILGEADEQVIGRTSEMMQRLQVHPSKARTMLNQWLLSGQLLLTSSGWHWIGDYSGEPSITPDQWIEEQIQQLAQNDLYMLAILASFPPTIHLRSIAEANQVNLDRFIPGIRRLADSSLIEVISWDCLLVPVDVRLALKRMLPEDMKTRSGHVAFTRYRHWRPNASSVLLEMAKSLGNLAGEYYYLIRYYREHRSVLMLEQTLSILIRITELHTLLARPSSEGWLRRQITVYLHLGDWSAAEKCAEIIYERTGSDSDWFRLMQIRLMENKLDLSSTKPYLFEYVTDRSKSVNDRAHAFYVLIWYWAMENLSKTERQILHETYMFELYPYRDQLKREIYLLISTRYAQFLLEFFPEQEEWTLSLLTSLETLIENSGLQMMKLRVYAAYMFHRNMRNARSYILKLIEGAKRLGIRRLEQISQANGAETAIYVGDIQAFWYHRERASNLIRKDWISLSIESMLLYCCEWNDVVRFRQFEATLNLNELTPIAKAYWEITNRYLDYQNKVNVLPSPFPEGDYQESYFTKALMAASQDDLAEAVRLWKACIHTEGSSPNGIRIMTGWSYRELIHYFIVHQPEEANIWLIEFRRFISHRGYHLFWPDYYYFSAQLAIRNGKFEDGLSLLDRAIKGYRLQGKVDISHLLEQEFQSLLEPSYLSKSDPLLGDPKVRRLLQDREDHIRKSLRFLLNLRLSEQLPETPDISRTIEKLIQLLFDYFPIKAIVIDYELRIKQGRQSYTSSGPVHPNMFEGYQSDLKASIHYADLYIKTPWRIGIEMHLHHMEPWDKEQLESVLNMARPHISASVLILEMNIDDLTNLYLRDHFMERLRHEFELSKKWNLDLSVIMMDLDNFRLINEHGHQVGDRVLRETGDVIRYMIGPYAVPGRYGGEEFILILPKTSGPLAMRIAEQLRERIQELSEGRPYTVSASIGVSSLSWSEVATPTELIRLADEAEILAKKTGKNQVVAAR